MKILIVSKFYPPENSARAIQMSKVVESIVRHKDCMVQILAGLRAGDKPAGLDYPVEYVGYENWAPTAGLSIFRRLKTARQNLKCTSAWITDATKAGLKMLETFKPDVILSASNPLDCHQVALNILKKHRIPWVAFFSDIMPPSIAPWPYHARAKPTNFLWLRKLRKRVTQTLLKSDAVVMSNKLAFSYMSEKLGMDISAKSHAIPHVGDAFESGPSGNIDTEPLEGRIVHIGLIDKARNCPELLEAARLVHKEMPDKFRGLIFVGNVEQNFINLTTEQERESLFMFKGKVSPAAANEYIRLAQSLLLVEANMAISPYLPSKMAEYAVNGNNIIAVTPPKSSIRQYMDEFGGGFCASRDINEIANAIRSSLASVTRQKANPLAEIFSSQRIAESYYHIFMNLLKRLDNHD